MIYDWDSGFRVLSLKSSGSYSGKEKWRKGSHSSYLELCKRHLATQVIWRSAWGISPAGALVGHTMLKEIIELNIWVFCIHAIYKSVLNPTAC